MLRVIDNSSDSCEFPFLNQLPHYVSKARDRTTFLSLSLSHTCARHSHSAKYCTIIKIQVGIDNKARSVNRGDKFREKGARYTPVDPRERCPRQRKAPKSLEIKFFPGKVARPHGPQIHKIQYATRASRLPAMEWGRLCDDVSKGWEGSWKRRAGDVGKGWRSRGDGGGREPQTGHRFIVYIKYVPFHLRRASWDQLLLHIPSLSLSLSLPFQPSQKPSLSPCPSSVSLSPRRCMFTPAIYMN